MIFAIDFDGTCVEHLYPNVGQDLEGAVETLKALTDNGHQLILLTMRGSEPSPVNEDKTVLDDAVQWFNDRNIPLYAVNENPTQRRWTDSPKVYAHIYIDDANLGCPRNQYGVDWKRINLMLKNEKYI